MPTERVPADDPDAAACRLWFPWRRLNAEPPPRVRLFCLPHAGAGALSYAPWTRGLGPEVELCAVEPPGRGRRVAESPQLRLAPLVDELAAVMVPLLDVPYVLYGHSMGALLAYELGRRLDGRGADTGALPPSALVVSGMVPPPRWPPRAPMHRLPTPELLGQAGSFLRLPEEGTCSAEMVEAVLSVLRADLELAETYRHRPGRALSCPVTVLAGADDPLAPVRWMEEWESVTEGGCAVRVFPGGHFFPHESGEARELLGEVVRRLVSSDG
ncbi:thioesterase [Streptomyces sp. AJS327]|uniref:thioesterase II family protein n=1 Tax=Streptomyces sp. AJS327 TaxID=2545265 RepID=UPI0015DDB17D|nr:alpha/beta fold hydrolase [Streptomyces sp. AJS327]MBA0052764.1 thioesterase [Streptomyces sp. AJS327]